MKQISDNLLKRIEKVQKIVYEHYEPGNQSRCKLQVYRRHVMDVYPISERTFWRYMNVDVQSMKEIKETMKKGGE